MIVSELIAKLQKYNPDARVVTYLADHEDMETSVSGVASRAELDTPDPADPEYKQYPYCKGDTFEDWNERNNGLDYVVIGASVTK